MTGTRQMRIAALIVAAGRGTRAGGEIPKQWRPLAGRRVIDWTLDAFRRHPLVDGIAVVLHPDDASLLDAPDVSLARGGPTRRESVRAGLESLAGQGFDAVLIHDAARATVPDAVITAVAESLLDHAAAAAGLPVTDALWRSGDGAPIVGGTESRDGLYRAQTPQGFRFEAILAAHRAFAGEADDDVAVARAAGIEVRIAPGHPDNIKITAPGDFDRAERILKGRQGMDIRLGNGFDVHRFGPGDHVTLCGVQVPHSQGLEGHSDADVGMHAITDAIYGALADGDIGRHFPPSDPKWKGADSRIFLDHAVRLAADRGFGVANVDCTLICEAPKIAPHAAAMQRALAAITGIGADRISVKATTSEKLGFTGRGEGIAAIATATLVAR